MTDTERRRDPFRVQPGPQLGRRLMRAVALSVSTALLLAGLSFDAYVYFSLRAAMVDDLTAQAHIVADNSSAAVLFGDNGAAAQTLSGLQSSEAIERASLHDLQGRLLAAYNAPGLRTQRIDTAPTALATEGHRFAENRLQVRVPVREGDRVVGHVLLSASLRPLYERVAAFVAITLVVSLVSFALAFALAVGIRRQIDGTEKRLDYLAHYDPVTGLPNRHAANEQIQRLIETVGRTSEGFGLLLLDLDDFKLVNDTLGHGVGDELLRALAGRLTKFMRPTDIAFRFGGDEFVILSPRVVDPVQLQALANAAMRAFDEPLAVGAQLLRVRGSAGVALYPNDAVDAASLVLAADTAMYEAKRLGKNTFAVFQPRMLNDTTRRVQLEADLREAVSHQQLRLLYQPIVDLVTQRLVGVEALLRWEHPRLGQVSPVEFIPIAEASGLIVDIGQWVLHAACLQIRRWHDAGHRLHVAVNVSALQIRRGIQAQIDAALRASGADPRSLQIEITEHSMVEDLASNVAQLEAVRALGIQVAVDDFGTGLSSLAYLKRLPIGKLKIDRAFVKDLPDSSDDAAIASAIISMAHSLSLTVVAEGIETVAQRDFLAAQRCDFAQGFLYSRPVAAQAIDAMLAGGRVMAIAG
ncbi:GGDEF and EAL domain-containing protein [Rhizobacter sp. SG703]|uniref:putative bifunctional diguanylate cyclase/phosphodiesterase n=1 Tax=Rhizobacter sp. SG703 TaxID=2587140 RepID=UPI0014486ABC|nr:GGDEF and EAL domain-containing protein [Rhizobacter sp. SG703]NKI95483.1 diguanylate cyclase (GGDEF)-like protein [Rhizobacter sp. SG703]